MQVLTTAPSPFPQVNDKLHGMGSFGRDDLSLLQRFAIQCGISLRNAGSSATFQSASPTVGQSGAVLIPQFGPKSAAAAAAAVSQDRAGRSSSPDIPHSPEAPLGSSRRSRRKQRTEDVGSQCNLLNAPSLTKLKKEHGLTKHGPRAGGGCNVYKGFREYHGGSEPKEGTPTPDPSRGSA